MTREAEVTPDRSDRSNRHFTGRRGDRLSTFVPHDTHRGRDHDRDRRRGPSEDRTDGGHSRQYDRGPQYEEVRRRSPDRDFGFSRWHREQSRSRSREPEQPADGAEGSAPKAEKDTDKTKVAPDRRKSRSPSAKPGSTAFSAERINHMKRCVAHMRDTANAQCTPLSKK